jgi:hypothetical protein
MATAIRADHMAGSHVFHFKPAAGAFDNILLLFQTISLPHASF